MKLKFKKMPRMCINTCIMSGDYYFFLLVLIYNIKRTYVKDCQQYPNIRPPNPKRLSNGCEKYYECKKYHNR